MKGEVEERGGREIESEEYREGGREGKKGD